MLCTASSNPITFCVIFSSLITNYSITSLANNINMKLSWRYIDFTFAVILCHQNPHWKSGGLSLFLPFWLLWDNWGHAAYQQLPLIGLWLALHCTYCKYMVWWHRGDMLYTLYQLQYRERSAVFTTARSVVQTRQGVRKLGVMNIYDSVHIGMQLERRWVGSSGLRNSRHGDSFALARSAVPHVVQGRKRRQASVEVWSRKASWSGQKPLRFGQENERFQSVQVV